MKFLRRDWFRFSKFKKKKAQKWRRPTGRDNKMREKRKGYPAVVSIGYKNAERKKQVVINNLSDLEKVGKKDLIILGKVGKKKKIEILGKAKEKGIQFSNLKIKNKGDKK
jgi:large subunit ribosomal protein L32e